MKQREFYQQNLSGDAFPDGIAEYCQFITVILVAQI